MKSRLLDRRRHPLIVTPHILCSCSSLAMNLRPSCINFHRPLKFRSPSTYQVAVPQRYSHFPRSICSLRNHQARAKRLIVLIRACRPFTRSLQPSWSTLSPWIPLKRLLPVHLLHRLLSPPIWPSRRLPSPMWRLLRPVSTPRIASISVSAVCELRNSHAFSE